MIVTARITIPVNIRNPFVPMQRKGVAVNVRLSRFDFPEQITCYQEKQGDKTKCVMELAYPDQNRSDERWRRLPLELPTGQKLEVDVSEETNNVHQINFPWDDPGWFRSLDVDFKTGPGEKYNSVQTEWVWKHLLQIESAIQALQKWVTAKRGSYYHMFGIEDPADHVRKCKGCITQRELRERDIERAAEFLGCEPSGPMVDLSLARVEMLRQELKAGPKEDVLDAWDRFIANGSLALENDQ